MVNTPYRTDEVFDGARYDDWGNDTIWLPSMTEVGALKEGENPGYTYIPNDCVWKLSQNQRKHTGTKSDGTVGTTTDSWSWFRSGVVNRYHLAWVRPVLILAFGFLALTASVLRFILIYHLPC